MLRLFNHTEPMNLAIVYTFSRHNTLFFMLMFKFVTLTNYTSVGIVDYPTTITILSDTNHLSTINMPPPQLNPMYLPITFNGKQDYDYRLVCRHDRKLEITVQNYHCW